MAIATFIGRSLWIPASGKELVLVRVSMGTSKFPRALGIILETDYQTIIETAVPDA